MGRAGLPPPMHRTNKINRRPGVPAIGTADKENGQSFRKSEARKILTIAVSVFPRNL